MTGGTCVYKPLLYMPACIRNTCDHNYIGINQPYAIFDTNLYRYDAKSSVHFCSYILRMHNYNVIIMMPIMSVHSCISTQPA